MKFQSKHTSAKYVQFVLKFWEQMHCRVKFEVSLHSLSAMLEKKLQAKEQQSLGEYRGHFPSSPNA